MSFAAMAWAVQQNPPQTTDRLVLLQIASMTNQDGIAWPSYQHLADVCGVNRSTVIRSIDRLIDNGLVKVEKRRRDDGLNRSNVYRLAVSPGSGTVPPLPAASSGAVPPGSGAVPPPGSGTVRPINSNCFETINETGVEFSKSDLRQLSLGQLVQYARVRKLDPIAEHETADDFIERICN